MRPLTREVQITRLYCMMEEVNESYKSDGAKAKVLSAIKDAIRYLECSEVGVRWNRLEKETGFSYKKTTRSLRDIYAKNRANVIERNLG